MDNANRNSDRDRDSNQGSQSNPGSSNQSNRRSNLSDDAQRADFGRVNADDIAYDTDDDDMIDDDDMERGESSRDRRGRIQK